MCVRANYVAEYVVLEEFSPPVVTNLTSAVHGVTWVTEASLIEKKPEKVLMGKIRQYLDGPNYSAIYIGIYATV